MASRGHGLYEGRSIQAPGMMRHGPVPGALGPAAHHPLEHLPLPELLENKMASQAAEIEKLLMENRRLAATNEGMRQEIGANQQEAQRIKSHIGSIRTEADIQVRGLVEKIRKMEDDIRAGEMVKEELQQAHKEAKSLIITRQELSSEIQVLTEELQKTSGGGKRFPELLAELDVLRQEHQKLRGAFEREKGSNMEQVQQMRDMEKNLISLAREVEKLRSDVSSAEKGERVANPYPGSYGNPGPLYPSAGQGMGYGHGHGGGYLNAAFGHGSPAGYAYGQPLPQVHGDSAKGSGSGFADGYARHHAQMSSAAAAASAAGYSDGYGRPQVPAAGSGAPVGEGTNHYGGGKGVSPVAAARGGS